MRTDQSTKIAIVWGMRRSNLGIAVGKSSSHSFTGLDLKLNHSFSQWEWTGPKLQKPENFCHQISSERSGHWFSMHVRLICQHHGFLGDNHKELAKCALEKKRSRSLIVGGISTYPKNKLGSFSGIHQPLIFPFFGRNMLG